MLFFLIIRIFCTVLGVYILFNFSYLLGVVVVHVIKRVNLIMIIDDDCVIVPSCNRL